MSGALKKRLVIVVLGAVLLVGAAIGIGLFVTRRSGEVGPVGPDRVKLELRGKPVATIEMNGKKVGKTPMTLVIPRGDKPITFEGTFTIRKINPMLNAKKVETFSVIKQIVPDVDQSVDFRIDDASKVEETRTGPSAPR